MELQPLKVDYSKARESLRQYLSIRKENRTAEDVAVIRSTKAILAGKKVIRLADAVRNGGIDTRGLPRIAVSRADDIYVRCRSRGTTCDMIGLKQRGDWVSDGGRGSWDARINQVNPRGFHFKLSGRFQDRTEAVALVPTIPPAFRVAESATERFYILFEAVWDPTPPTDPALLSPLGGGLFAVVAEWDLTDVERAVLADSRGV